MRLPRRQAALFYGLGLALLALKVACLDRVDNPWRVGYEGQVRGAGRQVNADLGGRIRLLAVDPLPGRLTPGSRAPLVLYWAALAPVDASYKASVQILDDSLRKAAHEEHYRPGGYPTVWWLPGEYNRDAYEITISPTAAPGRYHVLVMLYDAVSGERLLPLPGTPGAQWGALEVQQIEIAGVAPCL